MKVRLRAEGGPHLRFVHDFFRYPRYGNDSGQTGPFGPTPSEIEAVFGVQAGFWSHRKIVRWLAPRAFAVSDVVSP